jgi:hypothetical protein
LDGVSVSLAHQPRQCSQDQECSQTRAFLIAGVKRSKGLFEEGNQKDV